MGRAAGLRVATALALTLLCGAAWAREKGKPRPKADVVALRFGWPTDLSANVTYRWTRTQTGKPTQATALAARLTVAAEGRTLRVAYRDWKPEPSDGPSAGASLPSLEKISTIVDRKGAFVRVDGAVSAGDSTRIAATAKGDKNLGAEAMNQVAQLIPTLFQQNLEQTWEMTAGSWAGVELAIGQALETDDEGPVPLVPGATLKTHLRVQAERRLECPGDPGKRCVELRLRSEPDRDSLAKVVEQMSAKFGTKGPGASAADLSTVEEVTLVTRPEGLIPYRLDITKTIGLHGGGRARVDTTSWTYSYPTAR
jgi:hypothetical protein